MARHCPACPRSFETRQGLAVHHSHVHDEKLPNRGCANCGTRFHSPHEKKYCSETCRSEAQSFEGAANPNYKGGKEETDCESCGSTFSFYPSDKEGVYCPECVSSDCWQDPPSLEGPDNPGWSGGKVHLECTVCDAEFQRYPSEITGEVSLCSNECRAAWLSKAYTGEGHPNWAGGETGAYGPGWNRVRREALERDGYECVVCGTGTAELGRNPAVHHIIPVRAFTESDRHDRTDAHRLDNVVSLCVSCHRTADFGGFSMARLRFLAGISSGH